MERVILAAVLVLAVHSAAVQLKHLQADSATCALCKAGVAEMKLMIHDKYNEDLKLIIKKYTCDTIPIEDCDNWVTKWIANVDSKAESLDPNDACSMISMCTATDDLTPQDASVNVEDSFPLCEACQDFLGETKKMAHDPPTIAMAQHLLAPVMCDIAQLSRPLCEPLVNHFLAEGLLMTQDIDPQKTCAPACQGNLGGKRGDLLVEMADMILKALRA